MKRKVALTIKRQNSIGGILHKEVIVEQQKTDFQTKKQAELQWLNEYINRDGKIALFDNITHAKEFAKVIISSRLIN